MINPGKQLQHFLSKLLVKGGPDAVTENFAWLGAFALTRDGVIIAASADFCALVEYDAQELLGTPAVEVVSPEDRTGLQTRFAGGDARPYSLHLISKTAQLKHVLVVPYLFEANGTPHRLAGFTDISEHVALKEAELRFEEIFKLAGTGIGRVNPDGSWLECNAKLCDLLGYTEAELLELSFQEITHPDDLDQDLVYLQEMLAGARQSYSMEKRYRRSDGTYFWARLTVTLVHDSAGKPSYFISLVQDISEEKRIQSELTASEKRFRSIAEVLPVALYVTNTQTGNCDYLNPAFTDYFGYSLGDVPTLGDFLERACPDEKLCRDLHALWLSASDRETAATDSQAARSGSWMRSASGELRYFGWSFVRLNELDYALGVDLTASQVAEGAAEHLNRELEKLALTDGLTSLENRRSFDTALDREWRRASRDKKPLALIMADIDCFKIYNDEQGHLAGDDCLRKVGATLKTYANRAGDCVARYGGEEFAILLPGLEADAAADIAERVRESIEQLQLPHASQPKGVVTLSLGVAAVKPAQTSAPGDLLEAADRMLYEAKDNGRNRVEWRAPAG